MPIGALMPAPRTQVPTLESGAVFEGEDREQAWREATGHDVSHRSLWGEASVHMDLSMRLIALEPSDPPWQDQVRPSMRYHLVCA